MRKSVAKKPVYKKGPGISAKKEAALLREFIYEERATVAAIRVGVHPNSAHLWYRRFREAIYRSLRRPPRLFGEVEMDYAEFGGRGRKRMQHLLKHYGAVLSHIEFKEKAKSLRKEHKVMVFGFFQRGGLVYAHIVKRADADTIAPLVRLIVEKGARVYTDKWRGFNGLGLDGYKHGTVNHSREYVAKDGSHINSLEGFWSYSKRRLAKFNGVPRNTLPLHIKECVWRWNTAGHIIGEKKKLDALTKSLVSLLKNPPL